MKDFESFDENQRLVFFTPGNGSLFIRIQFHILLTAIESKVFLAAFDTLRNWHQRDLVCSLEDVHYALEDCDNCISVYVQHPFEDRIKRIENAYGIPNGKSKEMLMKKETTFALLQLLQF